jgi:hypothetical protein
MSYLVPNSCICAKASSLKEGIEARISARYLDVTIGQLPLRICLTQSYNEGFKEETRKKMSLKSLECGVCFLRFDNAGRRPIDLGCGHSFCQECTAKHQPSFRRCPDCREVSNRPHPNYTLLRILADMERVLEAQKGAAKVEMDRAMISQVDRALESLKAAVKVEVERSLEAVKVAFKAEIDNAMVAETALQGKIWDSGRTHSDIRITNNQLTIKREMNTTNTYASATINCPLIGSDFSGRPNH